MRAVGGQSSPLRSWLATKSPCRTERPALLHYNSPPAQLPLQTRYRVSILYIFFYSVIITYTES